MSNDLSEGWIVEEMKYQRSKIEGLEQCYNSLKVKTSGYATGLKKMLDLRNEIFFLCANFKAKEKEKTE